MVRKKSKTRLIPQYRGGFKDRAGHTYTEEEARGMLARGEATLAQWKGGKKAQRRGRGRPEGGKNLTRVEGGFRNQYGVVFTPEQRKALERSVDRSNYRAKKLYEQEGGLERLSGGKPTGQKVSQLQLMGFESDFNISRQSKSLQGFKTMADYEAFMEKQARIQSGQYLEERTRLYKRNHMAALENVFGDDARDVVMRIRMMKPEDYRRLIQQEETLEVQYVYDPSARAGKLNQIRQALGMREKESL